jgi:minor curlin subunit
MKKVIFCAGALMFGAMSFAQGPTGNSSDVDQIGNNNGSDVDQGSVLVSTVYQKGFYNGARVNQEAQANTANIKQVGDRNYAITQQNTVHPNTVNAGDNDASQEQRGDYNSASIVQDVTGWTSGNGTRSSEAQQLQVGKSNYASIEQSGLNLRSYQTQRGNNNNAVDWQGGGHHESDVLQIGNYNNSNVYQRGSTHTSLVEQKGDRNYSDVDQNGGWKFESEVLQTGDYNSSVVSQSSSGFLPDTNHISSVIQSGNGNASNVFQHYSE